MLLFGALLLCFFVWKDRGMYVPGTFGWGIWAFFVWAGLTAISFFLPIRKAASDLPRWIWPVFMGLAVVLLLVNTNVMYGELAIANPQLLSRGPIQIFPKNANFYVSVLLWLCLGLSVSYALVVRSNKGRTRLAILLLGIAAMTHLLILRMVPFPLIDVFTVVSEATVALMEGRNPYQISYTDIYQGQGITPSGFGYLPGLFPWSASGMLLMGDVRAGNFLALVGVALIFSFASGVKSIDGKFFLAGLLFLGGAGLFVAEQAWIDPILAFLIISSAWLLMIGRLRLAAILAGMLCATKQYGVVAFCFLFVMTWNRMKGKSAVRFFVYAFLVGLILQLPFLVWDFDAYVNTVFLGIGKMPFRPDAYTLVSWSSAQRFPISGIPLMGVAFFLGLLWRCRAGRFTDPGTTLAAAAVAYLAIFLTNRHAFCNYYQFVLLLLLGSIYFREYFSDDIQIPVKSVAKQ